MLSASAPLSRCHPRAVFAVWRKDPMEARQVDPRFRHQSRQPRYEVQRLEDDVRRAEKTLQEMTDSHIHKIDEQLEKKEEELLGMITRSTPRFLIAPRSPP